MSALQKALSTIREQASNSTELGNAFERLAKVFLEMMQRKLSNIAKFGIMKTGQETVRDTPTKILE